MPEIRLSANGQIELPGDFRKALGLNDGDHLRLTLEGNRIALTPICTTTPRNWRRWRGRLAGTEALQKHLDEHADEVRDECIQKRR